MSGQRTLMFNQTKKSYFNQVNMVESQYDSKKSNNSSLLQNRSPLRQRQNMNVNTPLRQNNPKKSLSPLRSRKNESYNTSNRSIKAKSNQYQCQNHNNKVAKYYVESETEFLYYCQNCAVRLASQGFSTMRICESAREANPRMKEINEFLESLEKTIACLVGRKNQVTSEMKKTEVKLEQEVEKIEEYYAQFYQLIDEHKNRVVEELRSEYDSACEDVKVLQNKLEDALTNSENMKKDISQSLNEVILDASEYEFRPVMDLYKSNLSKFRTISQDKTSHEIRTKSLKFRGDEEAVCQKLLQQLIIEWDDGEEEPNNEVESVGNPVESLQTEEKEQKSHLKQLGQLFSSFDE